MPTHPSRGNSLPTLANAIIAMKGSDFVFRAITRLDRDTSGIVLIAKNPIAATRLSSAMKNGQFTKKYVCTVVGIPDPPKGIISAPIEREEPDSIKRTVREDGKPSVTEYRMLNNNGSCSVCEVIPRTGRTHQIRVHMAYIGHPLLGDFLYGERLEAGYRLRCRYLSFPHPSDGHITEIIAPDEYEV